VLKPHPQGVVLFVRAQPGARKEGILGTHGDRLKIAVHAAPEQGKANSALIDLLADKLGLKRQQISLISGETNRDKTFFITSLSRDEIMQRLGIG
jgi:uncharacterized protein (TIGR00251 family)